MTPMDQEKKSARQGARIAAGVLLASALAVAAFVFFRPRPEPYTPVQVDQEQLSRIEDKSHDAPVYAPKEIIIPAIGVSTKIINVGKTRTGHMDVPQNLTDTGWYDLGPKPGEAGNAVIAGHVNGRGNVQAVFWDLRELEKGDDVYVIDESGQKLHFQVVDRQIYPENDSPIEHIFGDTDRTRLNLITCSYNEEAGRNADRLVVFTERVYDVTPAI